MTHYKPMLMAALLAAVSLLTACHTTEALVQHHTDTLRVETIRYDSIDRHHTHYIYQQGDTVHHIDSIYIDRYRLLYRDSIRLVHDTTLRTETKEIERKLTLWQTIRLHAFFPLLAIALLAAALAALRLRR